MTHAHEATSKDHNIEFLENLQTLSSKYQELLTVISEKAPQYNINNNFNGKLQEMITGITEQYIQKPDMILQSQIDYATQFMNLVNESLSEFMGQKQEAVHSEKKDNRFKDPAWRENIYFDFVRKAYLMSSDWMLNMLENIDLPADTKKFAEFYIKQYTNALSPTNFVFSNPEVLEETMNTNAANLVNGMNNLIKDLKDSDGTFTISTVDKQAFAVGKNIAVTPGKVIYQNDLMQLICYEPKDKTYSIPIFLVPPWINKYYILDLTPKNSLVKWLVEHNYQVFLVSWVNPDASVAHKNFEDYLKEGILEPIDYLTKTFGYDKVNAVGYCLGGTLIASAMAYMQQNGLNKINSSTLLTTLLDFSIPGDIGLFVSEDHYSLIEEDINKSGVFDARHMSNIFNMLRSNDMVWSFFVNNYLLGKQPTAFDILYWNSDSTNLPAAMHKFYIKNMYQANNLAKSCGLSLLNTPIDLAKVTSPVFILATKEDHIVPWEGAYNSLKLMSGPMEFCLAASGHVAGVVNHPSKNKYNYWTSAASAVSPHEWFVKSKRHEGSWWDYWHKWQKKLAGNLHDAINYKGIKDYIEPAPGSYVKRSFLQ